MHGVLAHGILCPSMSTAEEARKLVSFAKFPVPTKPVPTAEARADAGAPLRHEEQRPSPNAISGTRGVGSPFAPAVFRQTLAEYIRTANKNTLIAVQIETVEGLENCEEIASVDGIGSPLSPPYHLLSFLSKRLEITQICYSLGQSAHCPQFISLLTFNPNLQTQRPRFFNGLSRSRE